MYLKDVEWEGADDPNTTVYCASRTDDFLGSFSNLSSNSCCLSSLNVCLLRFFRCPEWKMLFETFSDICKLLSLVD